MSAITFHGGTVIETPDVQPQAQSATARGPQPEVAGDVLATARTQSGRPVSGSDIKEHDLITHQGRTLTVREATFAGLVKRAANGSFVGAGGQPVAAAAAGGEENPQDQQQQPEQQPAEDVGEAFDVNVEGAIDAMVAGAQPSDLNAAIEAIAHGRDIPADAMGRAASSMSLEPSEVQGIAEAIRSAYAEQASAAVAESGLEPEAVWDWAFEHEPELMAKAIREHAQGRSLAGYRAVAQAYTRDLAKTDPEAILAAELGEGLEVRQDRRTGKVFIKTKQFGEVEWQSAIRAGLVKTSRRK